jgi:hypothetical protein
MINSGGLIIIIGLGAIILGGGLYYIFRPNKSGSQQTGGHLTEALNVASKEEAQKIFDNEFREERSTAL